MSQAEITARRIYDTMHLGSINDEVKHHLVLLLSATTGSAMHMPNTLQEALEMGAMDLESARKELHSYAETLTKEYDLK